MAVIHQSFGFDLRNLCAETQGWRLDLHNLSDVLEQKAAAVFGSTAPVTRDYLRLLCLVDATEVVADHVKLELTELFLIVLGDHLINSSRLSNRAFAVLELTLPRLGWAKRECRELLLGTNVQSLAVVLNIGTDTQFISKTLRHIGWLDTERIGRFLKRLASTKREWAKVNRSLLTAIESLSIELLGEKDYESVLVNSYQEIEMRLEQASVRNECLLMFNDVSSYVSRPGPSPV